MNKVIKLNENYQYEFIGFSRNTTVQDDKLVSRIYVTLKDPTSAEVDELRTLALVTITDIRILVDSNEIYSLSSIDGKIASIDESVNEMGKLTCNLFINL